MKSGAVAMAGALLVASAATWSITMSGGETPADETIASITPPAISNRVFLTSPQLADALAAGTFERPVKSLLTVRGPLHFGDYVWDDRGVPLGPTWVRVDLRSQLISVFRANQEIGTAVIVYGADGLPTPTGKFPILAKLRNHRSATYDAPMPYTLRLTADGVSIHGSNVRWGAATHGCIGVPVAFAEHLFNATNLGDEVVVVGGPSRSRTS